MKITRENYEAYFLDYHEGNLSEGQVAELKDFLRENPELKAEFGSFEMITLPDDTVAGLSDKSFLRKPDVPEEATEKSSSSASDHPPFSIFINDGYPANHSLPAETNITEDKLIAWHEGDLTDQERQEVIEAIENNEQTRKELRLFGLARLQPDMSVVFSGKNALKRYPIGFSPVVFARIAVAAAVMAFIATLWFLLPTDLSTPEMAVTKPDTVSSSATTSTPSDTIPAVTPPAPARQPVRTTPTPENRTTPEQPTRPATRQINNFTEPMRLAAAIEPIRREQLLTMETKPLEIALRDEFYWLTWIGNTVYDPDDIDDEIERLPSQLPNRFASLASIATEGIERTTGLNMENVEQAINQRNFGLWDLAGYGLAGIGQLTGTSLALEREHDENGRLRSLGIGDRFKVRR